MVEDGVNGDAPSSESDSEGTTTRVSLSGGGVRATLFAFGALLYLLDSGEHTRVRTVSSVSGGSIANAVLAVSEDFSSSGSVDAIRARISRAAWVLSKWGTFFVRDTRRLVRVIVFGVAFLVIYVLLFVIGFAAVFGQTIENAFLLVLAGTLGSVGYFFLLFWIGIWLPRMRRQIAAYESVLAYARSNDAPWRSKSHFRAGKDMSAFKLRDIPESDVMHVFCATDLVSGYPVFMTRDFIENEIYGSGPAEITLAKAVYASAAFPAVFPAIAVPTTNWHGEGRQATRIDPLYLSDGGVFNNLGTEWFASSRIVAGQLDPGARVVSVVINASKPPRIEGRRQRKFRWHIPALLRALTVVQENTVSPRIRLLQDQPDTAIVDIAQSPTALLESLAAHPQDGVRARAQAIAEWMASPIRASHWTSLAAETSEVPTQLEAVGEVRARHLLRHGYINAAIAMHCTIGSDFESARARDEQWFVDLLTAGAAGASAAGSTADA